jgi:hypothetical protein
MHNVSRIIFIGNAPSKNIRKPNNLKVIWGKKTKGPQQDSQNGSRSPMPEGGEP